MMDRGNAQGPRRWRTARGWQTGLIAALAGIAAACTAHRAADRLTDQPTVVVVQAKEYAFVPASLHFRAGQPYDLRLENTGKETHELTAPLFFKAAQIETPAVLSNEDREILVQPGETKDLIFRAPRPGTYDMRCADHDWAGMVGQIVVE